MHSYLRAIGFGALSKEADAEKFLDETFYDYTKREIARGENNTAFIQMCKEYAPNMGIMIYGNLDENGFHRQHYFPYFTGAQVSTKDELTIEKRVDGISYAGVCDDGRVGVSIIFYVQNIAQYQRETFLDSVFRKSMSATLSGLSNGGMILLPVKKDIDQISRQQKSTAKRNQLLSAAKNGDEEAIESLTIEDMDMYSMISRRMYTEDIYSIIDTFFMPYGIECDQYQIMGNIQYCEKVVNSATDEHVYQMGIECNDLCFDICINEKDLLGEPEAGRRFKGNIWLQGHVNFE